MNHSQLFIRIMAVASIVGTVGFAWTDSSSVLAKQDEQSEMLDIFGTVANSNKFGDTRLSDKAFYSGLCDQWIKDYEKGKPGESDQVWSKILGELKGSQSCIYLVCRIYQRVESDAPDNVDNNSKYGMLSYSKSLLSATEKSVGPNHPFVADMLNFMGRHYDSIRDYQTPLPLRRRELQIEEKAFGPEGEMTGYALIDLAFNLCELGRYTEAQQLVQRTIKFSRTRKFDNLLVVALKLDRDLSAAIRRNAIRGQRISR